MKKIVYAFFAFFIGMISTKASLCEYSSFVKIQKHAMQVNITSSFEEKDESVTYSITVYNLRQNQYVVDTSTGKQYSYGYDKNNPSEVTINNIEKSGIYKFEVYSLDNDCNDNPLNTIYVTLPTYNKYYKDKLCKGIENYKLCQRWFGTSITYEQFRNQVSEYKASLNQNSSEEEQSFFDYILELYIDNYYIILPILIFILLVPIYIIYQKKYKVDF